MDVSTTAVASALVQFLPTLTCFFSTLKSGSRSYEGYEVLRVNTTNPFAYEILQRLYLRNSFDFWSPPSMEGRADVMVCSEMVKNMKTFLDTVKIPYSVMIPNLKSVVEEEKRRMVVRQSSGMNWETYHRVETIHNWMDLMAAGNDFVSVFNIGSSFEGRPLKVMKISTGGPDSKKPSIWIDGGIHAREWISPAVVTYIANELITKTAADRKYSPVDVFDWYFHPTVNPDGYEYSHSDERMWRKTRSSSSGFLATVLKCKGADPNRNFEYKWGGKGTSSNPCSDIYRGSKAASEIEISSIQNFILQNKDQFKLFLTFHSYSQMLFLPWGYDRVRTDDYDDLMAVATKAAIALKSVYGTNFQVGPSPELLYAAAGGSEDFAKGIANIKYAYCFELRDTGNSGFILPPDQIIPSGIETFAAVASMAEDMMRIYNLTPPVDTNNNNVQKPETRPAFENLPELNKITGC